MQNIRYTTSLNNIKIVLFLILFLSSFSTFMYGQSILLQEGFENTIFPPTGWHLKNLGPDPIGENWVRATGSGGFPIKTFYHSGVAGTTSSEGAPGEPMNVWLVSKPIAVPSNTNLNLSFWHRLRDNLYSDGPEYIIISKTDTIPSSFTDTVFTLSGVDPVDWAQINLSLPDYSGQTIYIAFIHTSANGYADAWCLDDILLTGITMSASDLGAINILSPSSVISVGQSVIPKALIRNLGTSSQTGFPVSFTIKNQMGTIIYSDTTIYSATLLPSENDTVFFKDFLSAFGGYDSMIARTNLTGDSQPNNDAFKLPLEIVARNHTGGPDAFGYRWIDSDSLGGPKYDWIEISQTGTPIKFYYISGIGVVDSTYLAQSNPPIPIGFSFPYYGILRDTLAVDIQGEIILKWQNSHYPQGFGFNWNMPSNVLPNPVFTMPANIAVFWDNLERMIPSAQGYYQTFGVAPNRFIVIEWNNFSSNYARDSSNYLTFQSILYENGDIVHQYKDVSIGFPVADYGVSATVGMQNDNDNIGLQYEFNGSPRGNVLHDSLAIRFYLPQSDLIPPTITHKSQTNTFQLTQTISAQIGDAQGVSADSIYYNVGTGWVAAAHDSVNISTNTYYFHIPAQVRGTSIKYYISAKDGSPSHNRAVVPLNAPEVYYQYKILPSLGVKFLYAYSSYQDYRPYKDNPAYINALNAVPGLPSYDTFNRDNGGALFYLYDMIFYNSPGPGSLDDENINAEALMTFLDSGTPAAKKKLFMTSEGYAWMQYGYSNDNPATKFFNQYLHAQWLGARDGLDGDPTAYSYGTINGDPNDFITNGQTINVFGLSPNGIITTRPLITIDTSVVFATFGHNMYAQGWSCGQKFVGEKFNTAFLSFNLWGIDSTKGQTC